MPLQIGIVGLPNVGKSTLFNALTKQQVLAANYPFATIDPNVGVVAVPDARLNKLAALEKSKKIVPTIVEFLDIAGLVRGASEGEGLGNKFLSHIREVDAIAHIVRFFGGTDIHHVENSVEPGRDIETINTELILADLAVLKKRLESSRSEAKSGDKRAIALVVLLERIEQELSAGKLGTQIILSDEEKLEIKSLNLLTFKPMLYVANTRYDQAARRYDLSLLPSPPPGEGHTEFSLPKTWGGIKGEVDIVPIDVKLEAELAELSDPDKLAYLQEIGLEESGVDALIKKAYETLGLITFLTTGPDETRAWTIKKGAKAPEAAGRIHTDFERGFIKAEVINWQKLIEAGSWPAARERGWVRTEGREYVMADGDVVVFKYAL